MFLWLYHGKYFINKDTLGGKMDENQIRQLVELVRQGNQQAFENLYEATKNSVYFLCISLLKNEEDAKDVMQDTYFTAYSCLNQLNDGGKFLPWINQIAANKCKRVLMQRKPEYREIEEVENECVEENENFLPEDFAVSSEKRKIVIKIMREALSDVQYETIILYYFVGMSIEEIAQMMECPVGTVKYRLSVARGKIKKGVLVYEQQNNEKLYSLGLPLLTYILYAEAREFFVPNVLPQVINNITTAYSVQGATVGVETGLEAGVASSASTTAAIVGKVGVGIVKKKIIAGVIALAVVGTGAAVIINTSSKKDKEEPETTIEEVEEVGDEVTESAEVKDTEEAVTEEIVSEFSGDWEKEEEYGYSPFWLKYANLASYGTKDLDSVVFYDKFTATNTLDEIYSMDEFCYFCYEGEYHNSYEEMLNAGYTLAAGEYISMSAYVSPDRIGDNVHVELYNMTDVELSLKECIDNNSYIMFDGFSVDQIILGEEKKGTEFRSWAGDMANILGTPDYMCCYTNVIMNTDRKGTDEAFMETVEYGGGTIVYSLIYERENYVIGIECSESNYFGNYEGDAGIKIWTRDVFERYLSWDYIFEEQYIYPVE